MPCRSRSAATEFLPGERGGPLSIAGGPAHALLRRGLAGAGSAGRLVLVLILLSQHQKGLGRKVGKVAEIAVVAGL
jgi:hypothetical protein